MKTLKERLIAIRELRGLSQVQLAEIVDISQGAIQKLEGGKSTSSKFLIEICDALDCDPRWLKLNKGILPTGLNGTSMQPPEGAVPVIEWNQVIKWIDESSREAIKIDKFVYAPANPRLVTGSMFALRVKGDSMVSSQKTFNEGSIIIVDPRGLQNNNKYVVAIKAMSQEAIFRKLIVEGGEKTLLPLNTQYDKLHMDNKLKILGVVKWHVDEVG